MIRDVTFDPNFSYHAHGAGEPWLTDRNGNLYEECSDASVEDLDYVAFGGRLFVREDESAYLDAA